jgi:L-histidine Nalpha-methyltransferase
MAIYGNPIGHRSLKKPENMQHNTTALKQQSPDVTKASFAVDVKKGLTATPKTLPSKYFYDAKGDFLFQQIMQMDEYYLTNSEFEILQSSKGDLLKHISDDGQTFDLIELGAGDGTKTKILLEYFLDNGVRFSYSPIDISSNALGVLSADLSKNFPNLKLNCICGDYLESIGASHHKEFERKVVLFLGSNIGNFSHSEARTFIKDLRNKLSPGDFLLIGFDLKKDPEFVLKAYNDRHGITAEFNLNLLERINRELGGRFDISQFKHFPIYDPVKGETRSYIISLRKQKIYIEALEEEFIFEPWEPIHTEVSKKYSLEQITALSETSGFHIVDNFFDHKQYFVDSLWMAR